MFDVIHQCISLSRKYQIVDLATTMAHIDSFCLSAFFTCTSDFILTAPSKQPLHANSTTKINSRHLIRIICLEVMRERTPLGYETACSIIQRFLCKRLINLCFSFKLWPPHLKKSLNFPNLMWFRLR